MFENKIKKSNLKCVCCENRENLHKFPQESVVKWCNSLNIPIEEYDARMRICKKHFSPETCGKRKLKFGAIPQIELFESATEIPKLLPVQKKGYSKRCNVSGCNSTSNDKISLFKFPIDAQRRNEWICATRIPETKTRNKCLYACQKHFATLSFDSKGRLKHTAVPNILKDSISSSNQSRLCSVLYCNNSSKTLFPFPSNEDLFRREMWKNLCGITIEEQSLYACEVHFKEDCFKENRQLRTASIPTIFSIPSDFSELSVSTSELTAHELLSGHQASIETASKIPLPDPYEFSEDNDVILSFKRPTKTYLDKRQTLCDNESDLTLEDLVSWKPKKSITGKRKYEEYVVEGQCSNCHKKSRINAFLNTQNSKISGNNQRLIKENRVLTKKIAGLSQKVNDFEITLQNPQNCVDKFGKYFCFLKLLALRIYYIW